MSILDEIEDRICLFEAETGQKPTNIHLTKTAINEFKRLYTPITDMKLKTGIKTILGLNIIIADGDSIDFIHLST